MLLGAVSPANRAATILLGMASILLGMASMLLGVVSPETLSESVCGVWGANERSQK
jgi:hypothetical protein